MACVHNTHHAQRGSQVWEAKCSTDYKATRWVQHQPSCGRCLGTLCGLRLLQIGLEGTTCATWICVLNMLTQLDQLLLLVWPGGLAPSLEQAGGQRLEHCCHGCPAPWWPLLPLHLPRPRCAAGRCGLASTGLAPACVKSHLAAPLWYAVHSGVIQCTGLHGNAPSFPPPLQCIHLQQPQVELSGGRKTWCIACASDGGAVQ